jgi:N-acetylglutamate synthase/N-acetylornithine aminotransferase
MGIRRAGSADLVLPSSTGIIGWRIPASAIAAAIPDAISTSSHRGFDPPHSDDQPLCWC